MSGLTVSARLVAAGVGEPEWWHWAGSGLVRLAYALPGSPQWIEAVGEMAARIEHIGRDHEVRRELWPDDEIRSGSLATLTNLAGGVWKFMTEYWFAADVLEANDHGVMVDVCAPDLEGADDPLLVIHEEVCS